METPILILNGKTQPYLSIGVMYGGMTLNGKKYTYLIEHDAFIMDNYLKEYKKHVKAKKSWNEFIEYVRQVKQ